MRPSREQALMEHARLAALRATCSRAQVGVVIALDGRILVTGYNGAPAGMEHCNHSCDCGYPGEGGLLFSDKHLSNCSTLTPCTISVHAEANAVAFAARHGVRLEGAELYSTYAPCLACAQLLVNSGIVKVHALQAYRDERGAALLVHGKIQVVDWSISSAIS